MSNAQQIVDRLLGASPAPTIAPPKPGTRPTTTPGKPAVRPGTRPWNPSIRPGVSPRPKARHEEEHAFAEAIPVPPAPSDEEDPGSASSEPQPPALGMKQVTLTDHIQPGDRVTIHVPAGMGRHGQEWKPAVGRAVMRNRQTGTWTLNMGGPYGRPGVASDDNIISIRRGGKVIYGKR